MSELDKSHMFWGAKYGLGEKCEVPRATYRCRARSKGHACKKVTDHSGAHECLCGREIEESVPV